uniref:Uncharacterized protein n=1 Tax=Callorhinchus milii TaxID=7868 RepID=A0A4W3GUV7_CALMI
VERMSWLSKLSLRGAGSRAGRAAAPPTVVTADPETCLMVFQNHWAQVNTQGCVRVLVYVSVCGGVHVYLCLGVLPPDVAAMGPILELVVVDSVLEKLLHWSLCRGLSEDSKVQQLKLYDVLVSQSHQPLLRHKPILTPLMRLLSVCSEPSSPPVENQLVLLLNQICVSLAKEPSTLDPSSQSPSSQSSSSLLLFSILVPFIHREGLLGQQARDALLLLMAISADNHIVASFIADNSYFCPVSA